MSWKREVNLVHSSEAIRERKVALLKKKFHPFLKATFLSRHTIEKDFIRMHYSMTRFLFHGSFIYSEGEITEFILSLLCFY